MATNPVNAMVIDASVAAKWLLSDEEYADHALLILQRYAAGDVQLFAPDQIRFEVPSAVAVATLGSKRRLTRQQGEQAIAEFFALGIKTVADDELVLAAYRLSHEIRCAFYDALYVALAERMTMSLVTADRKLYRAIRHLPDAVWLADYS